jgi:hypothetical protein
MADRIFSRCMMRVAKVSCGFRRVFLNLKILGVILRVGFVVHANDERLVVFSICKPGQTKEPGDIGGCRIATVLRSKSTQERFRAVRVESFDPPNNLMFSRRSIEDEIRWWHVAETANTPAWQDA